MRAMLPALRAREASGPLAPEEAEYAENAENAEEAKEEAEEAEEVSPTVPPMTALPDAPEALMVKARGAALESLAMLLTVMALPVPVLLSAASLTRVMAPL